MEGCFIILLSPNNNTFQAGKISSAVSEPKSNGPFSIKNKLVSVEIEGALRVGSSLILKPRKNLKTPVRTYLKC